jgi:membrane protease YdiL (CAAX protease family)
MRSRIFIAVAIATLLLERNFSGPGFFGWVLTSTVFLTGIPLLSLYIFKTRPGEVGLTVRNWRQSVKYAVIALFIGLPVMYYGSTLLSFRAYYPMWHPAGDSLTNFILYEAAVAILMFNTEFLFRGYLLFSLKEELGKAPALVLHAFPYMLVHLGKPSLEVPYSFFVGLLFGYMALKTKSILPSFLLHFLGSMGFEAMVLRL